MGKFIDTNYYCYNSISECLKHKRVSKLEHRQLLSQKTRLLIVNKSSGEVLKTINDIQALYLYPLSILDYCKSLFKKRLFDFSSMTTINIINFDSSINYMDRLSNLDLKRLSNVEIEINEKFSNNELNQIIELMSYFSINKIKITLFFKTINIPDEILVRLSLLCDFYKIMMPNILNTPEFNEFKRKLEIISSNKKDTSVILIKSYLSINQNDYYEETINIFEQLNVDIFQLSKELIPINEKNNPSVEQNIQDHIRYLEKKYNNSLGTRFVSVKDISTLYYPRFELDERNSRKCYACIMKPYLYKDKFLPCRVNKVVTDIEGWYIANLDNNINENNILKYGVTCDDCASIFENDILNEIETTLEKHKENNVEFILEMEG
ncbi:MAG: hypothetical protein GX265_01430 [Mollicutes bacterium]|nr:hypothetical protein [Mollicutes bacterium]